MPKHSIDCLFYFFMYFFNFRVATAAGNFPFVYIAEPFAVFQCDECVGRNNGLALFVRAVELVLRAKILKEGGCTSAIASCALHHLHNKLCVSSNSIDLRKNAHSVLVGHLLALRVLIICRFELFAMNAYHSRCSLLSTVDSVLLKISSMI